MFEVDDMAPTPVRTILTGYTATGVRTARTYRQIFRQDINYFNFRPIYYGQAFIDIFSVKDCFYEPNMKR